MTKNWDSVKVKLHELYMEKNLKLDDMIRIMKESYDFGASPRGYKKKFKQWGWLKNAPIQGEGLLDEPSLHSPKEFTNAVDGGGNFEPAQATDGPTPGYHNRYPPIDIAPQVPARTDTARGRETPVNPFTQALPTSPKRRVREHGRPSAHPYSRPRQNSQSQPGHQRGPGSLESISASLTGMGIDPIPTAATTPIVMHTPPLQSPSYPYYMPSSSPTPQQAEQTKISSIQLSTFKAQVIDPSLAEFPTYRLNPPRLKTDFIDEISNKVLQTAQKHHQKNDFCSAAVILQLGLSKITLMTVDPNELFSQEPSHLSLARVMGEFVESVSWENVYLFRNGFMLALLLSTNYEKIGEMHLAIYVLEQTLKAVLMSRVGILTAGEDEEETLEGMFEFADEDCSRVLRSIVRIRELKEGGDTSEHKAIMAGTFGILERFLGDWEGAFGVLGVLNLGEFLDGLLSLAKRHKMETAAVGQLKQILSKAEKVLVSGGGSMSVAGDSENFRWISARYFSRISRKLSALYELSGQALAGIHLLKRATRIVGSNHDGRPSRKEKREMFEATAAQARLQENSGLWDAADKAWKQLRGVLGEREDFELTLKVDVAIAELLARNGRQGEVLVFLEHRINECLKYKMLEQQLPSTQAALDDAEPIFKAILSLAKLRLSGTVTVAVPPPALQAYFNWLLGIRGLDGSEKIAIAHRTLELLTELQSSHPNLACASLIVYDDFLPGFIDLRDVAAPSLPQNSPHHTAILRFLSLIYNTAGKDDQPRPTISHIVTALSLLFETHLSRTQTSTEILLYVHSLTSVLCSPSKGRLCEECKVDEFTTAVALAEHYERQGAAQDGARVIARIIDEAESEFLIPATKGWVGFSWLKVLMRIAKFYIRQGQSVAAVDILERVHRASIELGDWDRGDLTRKVEQYGVFDESRRLLMEFEPASVLCRCV
ncbi:unnamed protein product [Tuber melanosporum]|uniref:(Perigord truffle) hypothetical protein n=1 Tax=Tuber melanosporum (strain Mel28) TaxID=656061 RepID=D5GFW4_TUBMM|nr:uncharacterized protein GSTUM_00007115001 [Tuber melanosporum]CAZ83407.1 unnamed protein product [Tuber melanosporum]